MVTKDVLGEDGFWRVKIIKVYDDESKNNPDVVDYINNNSNNDSSDTNTVGKDEQIEYVVSGKESDKEGHEDSSFHERQKY